MSCSPNSLLDYFEDADTKIEKICTKTGKTKLLKRYLSIYLSIFLFIYIYICIYLSSIYISNVPYNY
jgi:hypothetical protein